MEATIRPEYLANQVAKPALLGFKNRRGRAPGDTEAVFPLSYYSLLIYQNRRVFIMNKQSRNRVRKDSPRIIGTYSERIRLLQLTQRVWELLPQLHPELNFDHEAFAHITVGFLREKRRSPSRLMGLCSLSNPKRGNAVKHSERHGIHRILIQRRLVFEDPYECIRTIHHEFVHAMLKDFENPHGDRFWEHEGRIVTHIPRLMLQ
tara:strand:+ start:10622 stop:11236 length:615 start_codon:yes stop_codon:yes gene_type:complete